MPFEQTTLDIQTALAEAGYDPGPLDGLYGSMTSKAVDAWQKAGGQPVVSQPVPEPVPPDTMRTSNRGVAALLQHEGMVPAPYKDSVGVFTVYTGHTASAGEPNPANMPKAMPTGAALEQAVKDGLWVLSDDLQTYEAGVRAAFPNGMPQHAFDGAVSFHYNTGSIGSATWVDRYNAGDMKGAEEAFMWWDSPSEIIPRRQAEADLIFRGEYPGGSAAIWQTDGNYKVVWKAILTKTEDQIVALLEEAGRTP